MVVEIAKHAIMDRSGNEGIIKVEVDDFKRAGLRGIGYVSILKQDLGESWEIEFDRESQVYILTPKISKDS